MSGNAIKPPPVAAPGGLMGGPKKRGSMVEDASPVDLQTQVDDEMYQRMQDKVPGAEVMTKSELTRFCLARFLDLDDMEKARVGLETNQSESE